MHSERKIEKEQEFQLENKELLSLKIAILQNQPREVEKILELFPELINIRLTQDGETAIMLAVKNERLIIMKILLSRNPDLTLETIRGHTAGMFARVKDRSIQYALLHKVLTPDEILLLKQHPKIQGVFDRELCLAVQEDYPNIAEWLVKNGASLTVIADKKSLLEMAALQLKKTQQVKSSADNIIAETDENCSPCWVIDFHSPYSQVTQWLLKKELDQIIVEDSLKKTLEKRLSYCSEFLKSYPFDFVYFTQNILLYELKCFSDIKKMCQSIPHLKESFLYYSVQLRLNKKHQGRFKLFNQADGNRLLVDCNLDSLPSSQNQEKQRLLLSNWDIQLRYSHDQRVFIRIICSDPGLLDDFIKQHNAGRPVFNTGKERNTLLHLLAMWGAGENQETLFKRLTDPSNVLIISPDSRNAQGQTPLWCAARSGNVDAVKFFDREEKEGNRHLLETGFDPEQAATLTVAEVSIVYGREKVIGYFIEKDIFSELSRPQFEKLLYLAIQYRHVTIFSMLMKSKHPPLLTRQFISLLEHAIQRDTALETIQSFKDHAPPIIFKKIDIEKLIRFLPKERQNNFRDRISVILGELEKKFAELADLLVNVMIEQGYDGNELVLRKEVIGWLFESEKITRVDLKEKFTQVVKSVDKQSMEVLCEHAVQGTQVFDMWFGLFISTQPALDRKAHTSSDLLSKTDFEKTHEQEIILLQTQLSYLR